MQNFIDVDLLHVFLSQQFSNGWSLHQCPQELIKRNGASKSVIVVHVIKRSRPETDSKNSFQLSLKCLKNSAESKNILEILL